jgi:hypothetical protein
MESTEIGKRRGEAHHRVRSPRIVDGAKTDTHCLFYYCHLIFTSILKRVA